jgi:cobalt-zinc-cadmium efflux system membrane fusion protein
MRSALTPAIVLCLAAFLGGCGGDRDSAKKPDPHAGHGPGCSGHDHGPAAKKPDPHAGHDHSHGSHGGHDHGHGHGKQEKPPAKTPGSDAGHDHDHGGHGGHDHSHGGHKGHDHAAPARRVAVTKDQVSRFGIKTARAVRGSVSRALRVPGEIKINSDRMAHVVPQTPGVVMVVSAVVGQTMKSGQVMAVICSRELARAKIDYLAALEHLKLADETHRREEKLYKKKVSAEQEYLAARNALAKARIRLRSSRQNLLAYGVKASSLAKLAQQNDEDFASYKVVAPFDGTVIDKHIVTGEVIGKQNEGFVLADLSTVWVDLAVSQDAVSSVRKGYRVTIRMPNSATTKATLDFVSPVIDPNTRTALARAVLKNPEERFRPGSFVEAHIHVPATRQVLVVPKSSIQLVDDKPCIFVRTRAGFDLREVKTGTADGTAIEILSGVKAGEAVASAGAFHLKAEYIKSRMGDVGAHHGHSH